MKKKTLVIAAAAGLLLVFLVGALAYKSVNKERSVTSAERDRPNLARVIAQDRDDAKALNVTKTPEFFVNGKPLPSFGYEQLKALVDEALRSARR